MQQARSGAARYDGRTGSRSTHNTNGEKATTEVSNNNGTLGEGKQGTTMEDGTDGQRDAENGQGDDVVTWAETTGREGHAATGRHTADNDGKERETRARGRNISEGGTRRTTEVDDSFYMARDTGSTGTTATRRARETSEAPSVASPHKNIEKQARERSKRERQTGAMWRIVMRQDGAGRAST